MNRLIASFFIFTSIILQPAWGDARVPAGRSWSHGMEAEPFIDQALNARLLSSTILTPNHPFQENTPTFGALHRAYMLILLDSRWRTMLPLAVVGFLSWHAAPLNTSWAALPPLLFLKGLQEGRIDVNNPDQIGFHDPLVARLMMMKEKTLREKFAGYPAFLKKIISIREKKKIFSVGEFGVQLGASEGTSPQISNQLAGIRRSLGTAEKILGGQFRLQPTKWEENIIDWLKDLSPRESLKSGGRKRPTMVDFYRRRKSAYPLLTDDKIRDYLKALDESAYLEWKLATLYSPAVWVPSLRGSWLIERVRLFEKKEPLLTDLQRVENEKRREARQARKSVKLSPDSGLPRFRFKLPHGYFVASAVMYQLFEASPAPTAEDLIFHIHSFLEESKNAKGVFDVVEQAVKMNSSYGLFRDDPEKGLLPVDPEELIARETHYYVVLRSA
jgi:hypothetical protein